VPVLLITALISPPVLAASESAERLIQPAAAGFRCSVLARHAKLPEEEASLFSYGYKNGTVAVKVIRKESVGDSTTANDLSSLLSRGVSDDFLLGIIYWKVTERVSKFLMDASEDVAWNDLDKTQIRAAKTEFYQSNCQLLQ